MRCPRHPLRPLRDWPALVAVALALGSATAAATSATAAPAVTSASASSTAAGTAAAACAWTVVPTPSPDSTADYSLRGVAAASASDVWAVGGALIEHWNGTAWSIVPAPAVAGGNLNAVAARSSGDAWAVGETFSSSGGGATLIEHWKGASWTVVPSPNVGTADNALNAVVALSATNAWAVGSASNDPTSAHQATLIEHWNGSTWSVVASPNAGTTSFLNGVAAASASDVWAVGASDTGALIEHWNGTKWSAVASSSVSGGWLYAVTSLTASNAWAVGRYYNATLGADQTFVEHWNGTKWTVVPSPNATTPSIAVDNILFGVAAVSASNVWAVGDVNWDPTGDQYHTLLEHWNGTAWHLVTGPSIPRSTNDALFGMARVSGTAHLWAVGYATPSGNGTPMQPLTEFRC